MTTLPKYTRSADGVLMRIFYKSPRETLDTTLGWGKRLAPDDRITAVHHDVPAGLHLISENKTDDKTTLWTSQGTLGASYEIGCLASTLLGRVLYRGYLIVIIEKGSST